MINRHYPFHSLAADNKAALDYAHVMRVLGPRYTQQPAQFKGSRDLIKQFVVDTTREIAPQRSDTLVARIGRWLAQWL